MSARPELLELASEMGRMLDSGQPIHRDDVLVMTAFSYRLGRIDAKKLGAAQRRDRLAEIVADMFRRLDDGEYPTADELVFAEILDERIKWVDAMHEIKTVLEGAN